MYSLFWTWSNTAYMSAALCAAGGPAVLLNVWTQSRETISLTQPDHRWVVVSGNAAFHFRIQQLGERAVASCCSAAVSAASSGICSVGKCKWDSLNPVDPHNWTISHNHQAAVTQSHNECYLWSHAQLADGLLSNVTQSPQSQHTQRLKQLYG